MPLFRKAEASPVSELDFGTLSLPHSWAVLFKQQRGCQHTAPVSGAITALLCFHRGENRWLLDRVTDTALTELTTTSQRSLSGVQSQLLLIYVLVKGYPYSKTKVTKISGVFKGNSPPACPSDLLRQYLSLHGRFRSSVVKHITCPWPESLSHFTVTLLRTATVCKSL